MTSISPSSWTVILQPAFFVLIQTHYFCELWDLCFSMEKIGTVFGNKEPTLLLPHSVNETKFPSSVGYSEFKFGKKE